MKTITALFLLATPVFLAAAPAGAQTADEAALAKACRFDIHLWCADARLRQECLVTRWTKLSNACQDALVLPGKDGDKGKPAPGP
jgi:hypothetical protein